MKLRVLTLHYGADAYLASAREINERYCQRHGLEFHVRVPRGAGSPWMKVPAVLQALAGVDAVLYLDADAVFVDHATPPDWLLGSAGSASMVIGEDFKPGVANTGVWLIRNEDAGRAILETWASAPDRDPSLLTRWPLDEAGFNEQVLPAHREQIALYPREKLNLVDGDFIRHHMAEPVAAKNLKLARERRLLAERHQWRV